MMTLIEEAVDGCRRALAGNALKITLRTYQRWMRNNDGSLVDGRKDSQRMSPANKLSQDECQQILKVANSAEFASSPPSQITPTLADRGEYLASESKVYRILKQEQQHRRGRASKLSKRVVTSDSATGTNRTACGHWILRGCRPA